jgi:hypothetical protein
MGKILAAALIVVIAAVIAGSSGCNSKPGTTPADQKTAAAGAGDAAVSAKVNRNPGINLNCVYDRLQNPPESFHYLYKKDGSDHVEQQADVTPQTIDGSRRSSDGSLQALHGVRSDTQSWQSALAGLTAIAGMSSTVATVNHSDAMKLEQDGVQVNGYNTIYYTIDTARFDTAARQILGPTMGPGGFEKGEAWVTSEGCPVKLVLDLEMHKNDGSLLENVHYQESMVKK